MRTKSKSNNIKYKQWYTKQFNRRQFLIWNYRQGTWNIDVLADQILARKATFIQLGTSAAFLI